MDKIEKLLFDNRDEKYQKFHSSLVPTLESEKIIGVRMPALRKVAKELENDEWFTNGGKQEFLQNLPHEYYEENVLHAILLADEKDFYRTIELTEKFLPYIDNWALCDTFSPKCFEKNVDKLWGHIEKWLCSNKTYTVRFGIVCAMRYFLDEDFSTNKFEKVISVSSNEYYVNMAIAWYVSVALVKQYDEVLPYIENKTMPRWVHNKSIQKACESLRISNDKKEYLKTLKMHE